MHLPVAKVVKKSEKKKCVERKYDSEKPVKDQ